MTSKERAKVVEGLIRDPQKFRRESDETIRREHPEVTEEQLEASWRQLADQFGL